MMAIDGVGFEAMSGTPASDGRGGRPTVGPARPVRVEQIGGAFLVGTEGERSDEQVDLLAALPPSDDVAVVVVAVTDDSADFLWPTLIELLNRLQPRRQRVVLAMSGAGIDRPNQAALAERIARTWKLTVVAPTGDVILVPGGTLFVHSGERLTDDLQPQWWSFAPDAEPEALGPRWPVPEWQAALANAGESRTNVQGALTEVPAGVLVRPQGSPPPGSDDMAYAVPMAADRPSILVDLPDGPRRAMDLIAVLSVWLSVSAWGRYPLRLVPIDGGDILALGQTIARELRLEVEVCTGVPMHLTPSQEAWSGQDPDEVRTGRTVVLLDDVRRLTWSPFVGSVRCGPPRHAIIPPPRPEMWRVPLPGMEVADSERGVLRIDDEWRLAVTRAGLWLYPVDAASNHFPDTVIAAWPVTADTVRLDVGIPDEPLDHKIWSVIDRLLAAVSADMRSRLLLVVHGITTEADGRSAQNFAAVHMVRLKLDTAAYGRPPLPPAHKPTAVALPPPEPVADPARRPRARHARPMAVLISPTHWSTGEERAAFREVIGLRWDSQAAPVSEALSRLPAVGAGERGSALVDLVAVRLYLTAQQSNADDEFGPAALRSGDERLRPFLACLASGLRRLPTYRGAVIRGFDTSEPALSDLHPGESVLTEVGPVGGRSLSGFGADSASAHGRTAGRGYRWPPTTAAYVIWSDTARWVSAFLDTAPPTENPASREVAMRRPASPTGWGDVVFGPGSRFVVLDVRSGDANMPDLVLLRELPATASPIGEGGQSVAVEVPPTKHVALDRLDKALQTAHPQVAGVGSRPWPPQCLGSIGGTGADAAIRFG
ncbi:hypothetical protein [Actinoallomurus sp. NPDC050550]|uniref:hypothetical protein n=1 Tax=Actinoallomurus sp. NPDC050550 TaxID=3154937 RepID=UPI0033FA307A